MQRPGRAQPPPLLVHPEVDPEEEGERAGAAQGGPLEVEWGGAYYNSRISEIIAKWRRGRFDEDIPAEDLDFIVRYEFQAVQEPSRKMLLDAVLRTPEVEKQTRRRYNPETGWPEAEWSYDPETGKSFSDNGIAFAQGQYVEFLGVDMKWHLAPVRRVVRSIPAHWIPNSEDDTPPYQYFYNCGGAEGLEPKHVRAPEEALKLIYGYRPWVWQQWAMLKLENLVRFDEGHDMDYQSLNYYSEGTELWKQWLADDRNKEFRAHVRAVEKEFKGSLNKLATHILSPFAMMDDITKNERRWGLEDESANMNVFMYASVLGSGYCTALVLLWIQLLVPILLLQTAVTVNPDDGHIRFNVNGEYDFSDPNATYKNEWELFCNGQGSFVGKTMNITVLLLYSIRILPDLMFSFFAASGEVDEARTRVNELRRSIWENGDDTVWQQIGYKLEKYINGVYVSILMSAMLLILFLTDSIFDIILNALALEFVHGLDEELARGAWFDPNARWITGGVAELVIRGTLRTEYLRSWTKFCAYFDISQDAYREAFDGKPMCLWDSAQAKKDIEDPTYLSKKGRFYYQARKLAENAQDNDQRYHITFTDINEFSPEDAIKHYKKKSESFGVVDAFLVSIGLTNTGMFHRFHDYYVWSRWEKVLFLAPVPTYNKSLEKYDDDNWNQTTALASNNIRHQVGRRASKRSNKPKGSFGQRLLQRCCRQRGNQHKQNIKRQKFLNFEAKMELPPIERFLQSIVDVLMFKQLYKSIQVAWRRSAYQVIIFRLLDGVLDWMSYAYQLAFPFTMIFFYYLSVVCY